MRAEVRSYTKGLIWVFFAETSLAPDEWADYEVWLPRESQWKMRITHGNEVIGCTWITFS